MKNFVETALFPLRGFAFRVPAEELELPGDTVFEVVVEYELCAKEKVFQEARTWVRVLDGVASQFVMTVYVPHVEGTDDDYDVRMFKSITANKNFQKLLPVEAKKVITAEIAASKKVEG